MGAGVFANSADTVRIKAVGIPCDLLAFQLTAHNMADLPVTGCVRAPNLGQMVGGMGNLAFCGRILLRGFSAAISGGRGIARSGGIKCGVFGTALRHTLNISSERLEGKCGNQQDCYQQKTEQLFAYCFHLFFLLKMFLQIEAG